MFRIASYSNQKGMPVKTLQIPYNSERLLEISISRKSRIMSVPKISIREIVSQPIDVSFTGLDHTDGNPTFLEQLILLAVAKQRDCKRVFEFGTFDGTTSANLAATLTQEAEILTIDLPAENIANAALPVGKLDLPYIMKQQIGKKLTNVAKVKQLEGDTATFDFSPWYGTRDFVFVDACHEYEYVLNDSEIAINLITTNGIVFWHDYGVWSGVSRALNELQQRDTRFNKLRHIVGTTLCVFRN
jgi:predicted O-methyltransferase YrrM